MRCVWYCLAVLIVGLTPHGIFAQADARNPVLEQIFADWKERQGLVKTARYVITGGIEYKEKDLPPGNPVRPRRTVLLLDMERKRWRLESSQEIISENGGKGRTFVPRVGTAAFDGTSVQQYFHRDLNGLQDDGPDLAIAKGQQDQTAQLDGHLYPLFFAHGIIPTVERGLKQDDLPTSHDAQNFEVRGRLSFHGRNCTVVRSIPVPAPEPLHSELWIDLSQKSAIYRHVKFCRIEPMDSR